MGTEAQTARPLQDSVPQPVDVETSDLAVTVENGMVALSGRVRCWMHPSEEGPREPGAEVVDDVLEVRAPLAFKRTDFDIARNVAGALRHALPCSCQRARLTVKDGQLTVDGELEWDYQHERIEEAIVTVDGVGGVSDRTRVSPHVDPAWIRDRIQEALRSGENTDPNRLASASVDNDELKRTLQSWAARDKGQQEQTA
jgi:osmotically-inducible protein OsmY